MPKLESKLGMELAGFDPLDYFTPEQVSKMRNMEPKGYLGGQKLRRHKCGRLLEVSDFRKSGIVLFKERNTYEGS